MSSSSSSRARTMSSCSYRLSAFRSCTSWNHSCMRAGSSRPLAPVTQQIHFGFLRLCLAALPADDNRAAVQLLAPVYLRLRLAAPSPGGRPALPAPSASPRSPPVGAGSTEPCAICFCFCFCVSVSSCCSGGFSDKRHTHAQAGYTFQLPSPRTMMKTIVKLKNQRVTVKSGTGGGCFDGCITRVSANVWKFNKKFTA